MIALLIAAVVFGLMLIEARRAWRNERAQRARGGIEPPDDVYKGMRIMYPAAFLAMVAEAQVGGAPPRGVALAGVALFAAAKALKWWAILTLGPCWTFRVIVVPGASLVAKGPYRYVRHPNYAAVIGELAAVALMTGARFTGPIVTLVFVLIILRRVAVEETALNAILAPIHTPADQPRNR
jgi:methyltransferase